MLDDSLWFSGERNPLFTLLVEHFIYSIFCLKNVIATVEEVMDSFIFHTIFLHLTNIIFIFFHCHSDPALVS